MTKRIIKEQDRYRKKPAPVRLVMIQMFRYRVKGRCRLCVVIFSGGQVAGEPTITDRVFGAVTVRRPM